MPSDPICGMKVSPRKGLRLSSQGQTWFFCSRRCLDTFVSEHDLPKDSVDVRQPPRITALARDKTLVVTVVLIAVVVLSYAIPLLVPVREQLFAYGRMIWWAVLLGLVLGGIIDTGLCSCESRRTLMATAQGHSLR